LTSPEPPRVLVVDDDEDFRAVLSEILGARGYDVHTAADGGEALALLRAGLSPSIILLDLRMPGMSGWQFRREQRRDPELADIPVLVLSGGSPQHVSSTLGSIDMLPKPIDLDDLTAMISRLAKP
jgi:CheY-like chemotaxis protein